MSSFTENLYLKRYLRQLQEENLKFKQILNEIYRRGRGADSDPNNPRPPGPDTVNWVDVGEDDLEELEELELPSVGDVEMEGLDAQDPNDHGLILDLIGRQPIKDLHPDDQYYLGVVHASAPNNHLHINASNMQNFPHYASGVRSVSRNH